MKKKDTSDTLPSIRQIIFEHTQRYIEQNDTDAHGTLNELVTTQSYAGMIEAVLQATQGNIVQSAKIIGISRNTLIKKINTLKLSLK